MFIHKLIFLLLILLFINNSNNSQNYFSSVFSYENLNFSININKIVIKKNDTLQIKLIYSNKSSDTILLIDELNLKNFENVICKYVQIENGGKFTPGAEYNVKLIKVLPNDSLIKNISINSDYLNSNNFKSFFGIFMSLGYINSMKKIYSNINLSDKVIEFEEPNIVNASSIVVFSSLTFKSYTAFFLRFINK